MHEAVASKGPWVAIPYFVSYVLFSTYIVLKSNPRCWQCICVRRGKRSLPVDITLVCLVAASR
eukprot:736904-Prymnesium_polylepis.2